jgi:hypothetical protein
MSYVLSEESYGTVDQSFSHAIRRTNGELVFRAPTEKDAAQLMRRLSRRHKLLESCMKDPS